MSKFSVYLPASAHLSHHSWHCGRHWLSLMLVKILRAAAWSAVPIQGHVKNQPHRTMKAPRVPSLKHHEQHPPASRWSGFRGSGSILQAEERLLSFFKKKKKKRRKLRPRNLRWHTHSTLPPATHTHTHPRPVQDLQAQSKSLNSFSFCSSMHLFIPTHSLKDRLWEMGKWNHKSLMGRNMNYKTQFPPLVCVQS